MPKKYEKKYKKRGRRRRVVKDPLADYQPVHGQTAAMREETELRSERKKGGKVLSNGNTYVQDIYK
jgi:hypothetical protein|tara:strand:- start:773 stop:970 length:198 start_codon:yes stop_codon:yes gene_type:complete